MLYIYKADVIKVYDGDTVTCMIDQGLNHHTKEPIRLFEIDCAEVKGIERPDGLIARDWVRDLILNKTVYLETIKDRKGKYGRYLGIIWEIQANGQKDRTSVNDKLVANGLAVRVDY